MTIKFTDCALKVMDVLWEMGEGNALDLVTALMKRDGWSKSTAQKERIQFPFAFLPSS